jgi:hypothetical protein
MNQALYAHMNNKNEKKKTIKRAEEVAQGVSKP